MLQDFAKSAARHKQQLAKKNQRPSVTPTRWILTIVATLAFAWLLYNLSQIDPSTQTPPASPSATKNPQETKRTTDNQALETQPSPRDEFYEFYKLLPESEVIAPDVAEYSSQNSSLESANTQFLLQAGSFRNFYDADRLRARLILEGLDARLEAVETRSGTTWHRVMVGPFTSRSKMNRAQDILAAANTESLVIPLR